MAKEIEHTPQTQELKKLNNELKKSGWVYVPNPDDLYIGWYKPDYHAQTEILLSSSFDDTNAEHVASTYTVKILRHVLYIQDKPSRVLFHGFASIAQVRALVTQLIKHVPA